MFFFFYKSYYKATMFCLHHFIISTFTLKLWLPWVTNSQPEQMTGYGMNTRKKPSPLYPTNDSTPWKQKLEDSSREARCEFAQGEL